MTKIEEMIKELCPNGVEWEELGKIFDNQTGFTPSKTNKEYWNDGKISWYTIDDIRKNGRLLDKSIKKVNLPKGKKIIPANSFIISTIATLGEYALIYEDFVVNQQFIALTIKEEYREQLNKKFLYYYFYKIREFCIKNGRYTGVPTVYMRQFYNIPIPIPPLKIQEKIVETLDKFTNYVTELTAELTKRRSQYNYYRDKLLSFEDEVYQVEWKPLGTLLDYEQPTKYIVESTDYDDRHTTPVLTAGQTFILGYTNETENIYRADKNSPVIIFDDFTAGNHWVDFNFKVKSSAMKMLKPKKDVNLRYCYHYMQTLNIDTTEHKRLWISKVSKITIPYPKPNIQNRIVQILDNFEAVCNDLNIGLPKEIALRQKQYEYFREILLTFTAEGVYTDSTAQRT